MYIGKWVTAYYYINSANPALCLNAPKYIGEQLGGATCSFNDDWHQEWFFLS